MVFVAGRLIRNPATPEILLLQQTPAVEQSLMVHAKDGLSNNFPHGCYVSIFARLRGRTMLGEDGQPIQSGVVLQALHTRFTNGQEVDPDIAQMRLMRSLRSLPKDAKLDTIKSMDVETPDEIKQFVTDPLPGTLAAEVTAGGADGAMEKDQQLIRNGNHAQMAGVIGFMEFRDGGMDPSRNRVELYVQQTGKLEEAVIVRIYGKQASMAASNYRPGHAIYVNGKIHMDVKKGEDGRLMLTPYLKTYSVESAQSPHIKAAVFPQWALDLYNEGGTDAGFAKRSAHVKVGPKTEEV